MFRRRSSQEGTAPEFNAETQPSVISTLRAPVQANSQQQEQQQSLADAIALARQQSRLRSSKVAVTEGQNIIKNGQLAPWRTRVQQQTAKSTQPHQQSFGLPTVQQQIKSDDATSNPQHFSVFRNPLSGCRQPDDKQQAAVAGNARQTASLQQPTQADPCSAAVATKQPAPAAAAASKPPEPSVSTAAEPAASGDTLKAATAASVAAERSQVKHSELLLRNKTLCFEVQPATEYNQQDGTTGHGSLDQQQLTGMTDQEHSSAPAQQYVYDEGTGQLCRVGEGADTTRLAHHYLEDWNTGEFFMMAEPSNGCMSWLRRKPRPGPTGWGLGTLQEPNLLHGLAEFTDSMGSVMAALGMFAQGMAGGLALLSFFMTYLQYATAGRDGLLAYYSAPAQMANRAFFTLISLSLVSAASRLAYDQLGDFKPSFLRLRVADGLVLALYLLAYVSNLIAAPIDDQLTFEARRDVNYWAVPQQQAFINKVNLWQVLNLLRIICCGLAWAIVSYRGNHMVMRMVFEARLHKQQQEDRPGSVGGRAAAAGLSNLAVRPTAEAAAGDTRNQTSTTAVMTGDQVSCAEYCNAASDGDVAGCPVGGVRMLKSSSSMVGRVGHVQQQASRSGIGSGRLVGPGVSGHVTAAAWSTLPPFRS